MIKKGKTVLNGIPKVALVINDQEPNKVIKPLPVDFLEIRVDQFQSHAIAYIEKSIRARKALGIPLILTVRNAKEEGGKARISDAAKLKIFVALLSLVEGIDIELKSPIISQVIPLAKKNKKFVIVSSHNFKKTPAAAVLEKILKDAVKKGADIVKIAAKANALADVNRLWQFTLRHQKDNVITMSLGRIGSISRLTFPAAGSLLTYSYVGRPSAPGQLPFAVLQKRLRLYYPKYGAPPTKNRF